MEKQVKFLIMTIVVFCHNFEFHLVDGCIGKNSKII